MVDPELKLYNEYKKNRNKYVELEDRVSRIIDEVIRENQFFVMEVSHRTKDPESLLEKLRRKSGKYNSLSDVTDLCGFRIVCYFSDSVDKIAIALGKKFIFDLENCVDKRAALQETQFGYLSLHLICRLQDSDIPFEIQIRTVLQHAWAEIEHDLGYKSYFGVPRAIRRNFSRVASLLEMADMQFVQIREDSEKYKEDIMLKIANDVSENIVLDKISLREYMLRNREMVEFKQKIKRELGVDFTSAGLEEYLRQLDWFDIKNLGELAKFFNDNAEYCYEQIKYVVDLYEVDIMSESSILKFLCEGELIREAYIAPEIRKFMSLCYSDPKKIERNVERIVNM